MEASGTGRECGADKSDGTKCRYPAGYGTDHHGYGPCKRHFGSTPAMTRLGFREMAKAMGDPIHVDPAEAMAQRIRATAGHVAWLEAKVGGFRFRELTKLDEDGVETEQFMTPNQESWWEIYRQESDRLVKYSEIALRAGLAERTVRLAEKQGEMLALVIEKVLDGLGLTEEQLLRVPDVVPAAMRWADIEVLSITQGGETE